MLESDQSHVILAAQGEMEVSAESLDTQALELVTQIQEIATAIEEVEKQTQANTLRTHEAKSNTDFVQLSLQQGEKEVKNSSEQLKNMIEAILGVITDIKKLLGVAKRIQTLGINALIEAEKAGEAGKRFSVVAGEMNDISKDMQAQLTEASQRLERLITQANAIEKADQNVQESFQQISQKVKSLVLLLNGIEEASEQQAQSIQTINDRIQTIRTRITRLAAIGMAIGAQIRQQGLRLSSLFKTTIPKAQEPSKNLLSWGPEIMLNIDSIDKQHKVLVDAINKIFQMLQALDFSKEANKQTIKKEIQILVGYTLEHFRFEQEWMGASSYSQSSAHEKEHNAIVAQVSEILERFDTEDTAYLCISLMSTLQGWLINHILISDKKYVSHLEANTQAQPQWTPALKRS